MDKAADPFIEPLSALASDLMQITSQIHDLQLAHSARINAAKASLQQTLQEEITTGIQHSLDTEFQEGTRVMRMEFDQRMHLSTEEWARERASLMTEIASLRSSTDRRELSTEIAHAEAAVIDLRKTIAAMVDDPTVAVSKLVRATAREAELQAYLKGLKFKRELLTAPVLGENKLAIA